MRGTKSLVFLRSLQSEQSNTLPFLRPVQLGNLQTSSIAKDTLLSMGPRQSSSRAASTKPWSSGRVLTPSQRERKRYKDRLSKQEKQEKENETLKHLQSQVVALQNALQSHSRYSNGPSYPRKGVFLLTLKDLLQGYFRCRCLQMSP